MNFKFEFFYDLDDYKILENNNTITIEEIR